VNTRLSGPPASQRERASFFSSVASFSLPAGPNLREGSLGGYYIDMRVKAKAPVWPVPGAPPAEQWLFVALTQWALGSYERYLAGDGEEWLASALACAEDVMALQQTEGKLVGGWLHPVAFPHTFALPEPWLSAMAQGEGASLLVRLYTETGDERFAEAARRALLPLDLDSSQGGVRALLHGGAYPEEYPTSPPSFVLNGGIFAMWGLHDVGVGLDDADRRLDFEQAVDTLAANLHRWDLGYWSRYDLYPHPVPNVASSFYHDLHTTQLRMMHRLSPRPELTETAERWASYTSSRPKQARAFAGKALFRLLVPRNRLLAKRLPWSPFKRSG